MWVVAARKGKVATDPEVRGDLDGLVLLVGITYAQFAIGVEARTPDVSVRPEPQG
jgi:hypothetical protein